VTTPIENRPIRYCSHGHDDFQSATAAADNGTTSSRSSCETYTRFTSYTRYYKIHQGTGDGRLSNGWFFITES